MIKFNLLNLNCIKFSFAHWMFFSSIRRRNCAEVFGVDVGVRVNKDYLCPWIVGWGGGGGGEGVL